MAENRDAGVDPRFDPVFQRGYDPTRHRAHSALQPKAAPEPAPAASPSRDVSVGPVSTTEGATSDISPPAAATVVVSLAADDEPVPPRRNPFRLTLLLASLVAVVGSGALLWNRLTSDPYYYGYPAGDTGAQFRDSLESAAIPALLVSGLTGLVIWLALGVLRGSDRD